MSYLLCVLSIQAYLELAVDVVVQLVVACPEPGKDRPLWTMPVPDRQSDHSTFGGVFSGFGFAINSSLPDFLYKELACQLHHRPPSLTF